MRRYPGLKNFEEKDKHIFFGRDKEIAELKKMISREKVILLYGKSGIGKSSLLKAGLVPVLSNAYTFVNIRLKKIDLLKDNTGSEFYNLDPHFSNFTKPSTILISEISGLINKPIDIQSLWKELRVFEIKNHKTIIFIFDQFEELFQFPERDIKEFANLLNELQSDLPPNSIIDEFEKSPIEERTDFLYDLNKSLSVKYIFSIRSDKVNELYLIKNYIPSIHKNEFEVKSLSIPNAEIALTEPSKLDKIYRDIEFESNTFEISIERVSFILDRLKSKNLDGFIDSIGINPIQLQIIGAELERTILKENISKIDSVNFPNEKLSDSIRNFYDEQLNLILDSKKIPKIKQVLEDEFIFQGSRTAVTERKLKSMLEEDGLIKFLLDHRIIKSENSSLGKTYELAHDILVEPIDNDKKSRKDLEDFIKAEEIKRTKYLEEIKQKDNLIKEKNSKFKSKLYILSTFFAIIIIGILINRNKKIESLQKEYSTLEDVDFKVGSNSFINGRYKEARNLYLKLKNNNKKIDSLDISVAEIQQMINNCDLGERANKYFMEGKFDKSTYYFNQIYKNIPDKFFNLYKPFNIYLKRNISETKNAENAFIEFQKSKPSVNIEIKGKKLKTLSNKILEYPNIKIIYLDGNLFSSFPLSSLKFPLIKTLSLSDNRLTEIDSEVFKNKSIQTLSLNNNNIEYLPSGLFEMQNLRDLNIKENKISYIEDFNFKQNSKINTIVLNRNPLGEFPYILVENLPSLKKLHLRNTLISELPPIEFLTKTNLEDIDIAENRIDPKYDKQAYHNLKNKNGKIIIIKFK